MVMLALRPEDFSVRGDFEDAVDVDFEDDFENGVAGFHWRYWGQSEFTERSVVL